MRKRRMAFDTLECVLPDDIDRLCPSIGEHAYVDTDGNGDFRLMKLVSVTPVYLTFRTGSMQWPSWTEVKVSRRRTGLGGAFVLWRSPKGWLHCQYVDEMP